jgi:hypothetical protein
MPAGVTFKTQFDLVNFECWQLGWVAYVVRDLQDERIRVGMGTSRGLGRVKGHLDAVTLEYIGEPGELETSIPGIGALVSESEQADYGFTTSDAVPCPEPVTLNRAAGSLRSRARLEDSDQQHELLAAVAPAWDAYIQTVDAL